MKNLPAKQKKLSKKAQRELAKRGLNIQKGDIIIEGKGHSEGEFYKISKITGTEIAIDHNYNNSWNSYSSMSYEEFVKKGYIKIDKPIKEIEIETFEFMKNFDGLEKDIDTVSESTTLAKQDGKSVLLDHERSITEKMNKFMIMKAALHRKYRMLAAVCHDFEIQLKQVHKVLGVIELYLGIHEEIIQIAEGNPAPDDEPIKIRQQLLYMDEEIGDPKDQGLDFRNLEDFDDWISEPKNLQKVLPETKAIVALRVRRNDKLYSKNIFVDSIINTENHKTYLLIRNGNNLYRIWSDVTIHPRLFPTKDEFKPRGTTWHDGTITENPFEEEEIKENMFEYKKYGLMLQGLLHRTNIFQPLNVDINIFDFNTWQGMLDFIKDDELTLPTGRLSWREWQKKINTDIKVGSRILYMPVGEFYDKNGLSDRVPYGYKNVEAPSAGIYTVIPSASEDDEDELRFYYLPGNEVYVPFVPWKRGTYGKDYGFIPRKKRVGFKFYDSEVLNYDQISLDDIEFYLESRVDRENYLKMIPLLWEVKRERLQEIEYEKDFVVLVVQRTKAIEEDVWEAVNWWKIKNKWKRPIREDDNKALRMIEKRVKNGHICRSS